MTLSAPYIPARAVAAVPNASCLEAAYHDPPVPTASCFEAAHHDPERSIHPCQGGGSGSLDVVVEDHVVVPEALQQGPSLVDAEVLKLEDGVRPAAHDGRHKLQHSTQHSTHSTTFQFVLEGSGRCTNTLDTHITARTAQRIGFCLKGREGA
jgi:hypothetical protein